MNALRDVRTVPASTPLTPPLEGQCQELSDYRFLLNAVFCSWKQYHARYVDLTCRLAAGQSISMTQIAQARAELNRTLIDFESLRRMADPADNQPESQRISESSS